MNRIYSKRPAFNGQLIFHSLINKCIKGINMLRLKTFFACFNGKTRIFVGFWLEPLSQRKHAKFYFSLILETKFCNTLFRLSSYVFVRLSSRLTNLLFSFQQNTFESNRGTSVQETETHAVNAVG